MKPTRGLACAFLVLSAGACGTDVLAPEDLPADLRPPELSIASWDRVVRDGFSFALPPGFVKREGTPIDSDAASYAREDDDLHYDYGAYSGRWHATSNKPVSEIREAWVRLGGRTAQLVSYRLDGRYVIRAWWENVGRAPGLGDLHLVVRGESETEAGRRELLAVIHSVRFD